MAIFEPIPDDSWTLEEWREAAGKPSPLEIVAIGRTVAMTDLMRETVESWREGTVQTWFRAGIANRDNAVAMIAVLREAARRKQVPLFDDDRLRAHADLFMRSAATRKGGFYPLSDDEIASIVSRPVPQVDPRYDDADLLRKVFPPPPIRPFGRDDEIADLLDVMRETVITVIVSDPGNGKTTLAWHTGRHAVFRGLVTGMDWNTDKRVMVSPSGEIKKNVGTGVPLRFETVLVSAVRRFGWDELRHAPEHRLAALSAKRLAESRYLLVVDNLETVPQASEMVAMLRGVLEPRGDLAPLASRALITSRVRVEDVPGVRNVHIDGLKLEPTAAFVRAVEADADYAVRRTEAEIERLWGLTSGNPLLIQIALTRCAQQKASFDQVMHDLSEGTGFMDIFDRLIGPLYETLRLENGAAAGLAEYAAWMPDITTEALLSHWLGEYEGGVIAFHSALAAVTRYGFLRPLPGAEGEYAMHPIIRGYLRNLT